MSHREIHRSRVAQFLKDYLATYHCTPNRAITALLAQDPTVPQEVVRAAGYGNQKHNLALPSRKSLFRWYNTYAPQLPEGQSLNQNNGPVSYTSVVERLRPLLRLNDLQDVRYQIGKLIDELDPPIVDD